MLNAHVQRTPILSIRAGAAVAQPAAASEPQEQPQQHQTIHHSISCRSVMMLLLLCRLYDFTAIGFAARLSHHKRGANA
jgi:hypothetical protein